MNDYEVAHMKAHIFQRTASALGIDPELYVSSELPGQIRASNQEMGARLDAFVTAFDAWRAFHKRIDDEGRHGQLTGNETAELVRLDREKDAARARLLAKVNEAKQAPLWVHGVIDSFRASLDHPLYFLDRGGWTWRFHTKTLEWVRPSREYFDPSEIALLDSFLSGQPKLTGLLHDWDAARDELEAAASAEWERVVSLPEFLQAYREGLDHYLASDPPPHRREPWGALPKERGPELIAEHVVNNRTEIEAHNTSSDFWHAQSARIVAAVQGDAKWNELNAHTEAVGARLRACGHEIVTELEGARRRLAEEYPHASRPPHFAPE